MINQKMLEAINKQINAELYSYYLYLSMSAYFTSRNLPGFANWMTVQTQEEMFHAMKFYNYVLERGGKVKLFAIDEPPCEWESPLAVFESAFDHEILVTRLINELVDLSVDERDHATNSFLKFYIDEQVEEEASADRVVQQLKLVGNEGSALIMLDRELAARVFAPPAPAK